MPRFNHVMIDLETLSLRSDACIVQIAAVAFDIETGEIGPRFNAYVNESCLEGATIGHVDVSTVAWWMKQARAQSMGAALCDEALPLGGVLCAFEEWYQELDARVQIPDNEAICLWSKGLKDFCWLEAAFERADLLPVPWHHRSPRDARTLFLVAPGGQPRPPKDPLREHDAQYDCEYQIAQVVEAWGALRRTGERAGASPSWTLECPGAGPCHDDV